jgi:hypothetical protein
MSKRSIARTITRAIDMKLAAHKSLPAEEVKNCFKTLCEIRDCQDADARTRHNAAKTIIEHDWAVYEHEHQKPQTLIHEFPNEIEIKLL